MKRLIWGIVGNTLALYAAAYLVSGFTVAGGFKNYLIAGAALGILNLFVKPVIKLISFPLIILTLGLFSVVINAFLLWLIDHYFEFVTIADRPSLFWATIVVSLINLVVSRRM